MITVSWIASQKRRTKLPQNIFPAYLKTISCVLWCWLFFPLSMTRCVWSLSGYKLTQFQLKSCQNKLWKRTRHMTQISPLLFTGVGCSWVLRLSSSSTLLQQLWQIHRGTSPSRDWDSEGTASASLRPGASRNKAWESAGTASASLVPWPPGSPFTEFAPQSLNSRWHSRQQVCIGLSVKVEKRRCQASDHKSIFAISDRFYFIKLWKYWIKLARTDEYINNELTDYFSTGNYVIQQLASLFHTPNQNKCSLDATNAITFNSNTTVLQLQSGHYEFQ